MEPKKLDYVQWDITSACNLNCRHCREKPLVNIRDDVDISLAKSIIDQIVSFGTHTLSIAGGEPLMSPMLQEVLAYSSGKFDRIALSSNGTLINASNARMLSEYVSIVQISFDGHDAASHDSIRGKGTFDKSVRAVRILQDCGVRVGVRMTLCRQNMGNVKKYIDMAKGLGLPDAYMRRMIPTGNAAKCGLEEIPAQELEKCLGEAISYGRDLGMHVASADYFCQIQFNADARKKAENIGMMNGKVIGGCAVGTNSFYLMQNGVVAYCPYLPVFCGDLRKETLEHIWDNSEMFRIARSLRHNLKGKCSLCRYKFACGGCRAYAYATTGDILAEDSGCWIS